MTKSRRLTVAQVRAAHRLIDECREVGDDPARWQRHLLAGVNPLVGALFSTFAELEPGGPTGPRIARFAEVGMPRVHGDWDAFVRRGQFTGHPAAARFVALPGPRNTRRRRELLTDGEWYRSAFHQDWNRPNGVDDGILSVHAGLDGWGFMLSPGRAVEDRPFTARDARLIHFIQLELTPHLGRSLATSQDLAARLSPRLRQTLDCLLDGDSEKQVAARIGVRPATVREYVQALYRHFGVTTRAELMARFLRRYRRGGTGPGCDSG